MDTQILTVSPHGQISLPVSIRKLMSIDTSAEYSGHVQSGK